MKHWIWAALAAGLLAGCGAQEAGKGQFRDVLARYAETNEVCLPLALDADGAKRPSSRCGLWRAPVCMSG